MLNSDASPATESRSYSLGFGIVIGTFLAALAVSLAIVKPNPDDSPRASQPGGSGLGWELGSFELTERSGRTIRDGDLAGRVWVASFIFTNCRLSCPKITSQLKSLGESLRQAGADVQLISITVDPERDRPGVLQEFADRYQADPNRWWFLTGDKTSVLKLVTDGFKLSALAAPPDVPKTDEFEEIAHSDRLALVDRGNRVIGFYDSNDSAQIAELKLQARRLGGDWAFRLPALNAILNGASALLLATAWVLILAKRYRAHAACMIAALGVSGVFLASYLLYHYRIQGSMPYRETGPIRYAYYSILISHVILAAGMLPLIAMTVYRAARRRFTAHARLARVTLPIWLYVSITGVVVYVMLY